MARILFSFLYTSNDRENLMSYILTNVRGENQRERFRQI